MGHAFFEVISTNQDADGKEFVSLLEARKHPFYSSQFHPEKNAFECASPGTLRVRTALHTRSHPSMRCSILLTSLSASAVAVHTNGWATCASSTSLLRNARNTCR